MRTFGPSFTFANQASEKSPRFAIGIIFDTGSIYLTSHPGIPNVPGIVIENVLKRPSAISQKIIPDEGRSEIGSMSFDVVDVNQAVTLALKSKLAAGAGIRGKQVRLYQGFSTADFSQYGLFQTQVIQGQSFDKGVLNFRCADITREQRLNIFDPKTTTLAASIDADDTEIQVVGTTGFQMIAHGPSFSDAPNSSVGYIQIQDEIISYTGIASSPPRFTGCSRGRFSTRPVPHQVDLTQNQDQRTKVSEYIYLELPVPKLILAILTGDLYGQSASLPDHWHLGIDAATWIKQSDFTDIGSDLWSPSADAQSFVAYFAGLKKVDGKQFLEKELYQLIGCYPRIYSDGRQGINRMNAVLADAPSVVEINEDNAVDWSALTYDMSKLCNHYLVEWNWRGENDDDGFTRITEMIDGDSIEIHGETEPKILKFKGLYGGRHTDATVRARINAQRDRYAHPPVVMTVNVLPSLNGLEVGDIVRVKLPAVRDFTSQGVSVALNRSFEIQNKQENHSTGEVVLSLFGSTRPAVQLPPDVDTGDGSGGSGGSDSSGGQGPANENSLPDSWYASQGTELSTVIGITPVGDVGVINTGTSTLNGHANLTNGAAIYYYDGDLELPNGATLVLGNNVQLRVKGFFTVNGAIDGVGHGLAGVAGSTAYGAVQTGQRGFFGNSRGMDGLFYRYLTTGGVINVTLDRVIWTNSIPVTQGQVAAAPYFDVSVQAGALVGLPTDLRGTSGGPGGNISRQDKSAVKAAGGTGGNGGAGLCIVCRGMSFGASGRIDLSGGNSSATSPFSDFILMVPGAGGAGAPGVLLILLDGALLSVPDLGGKFFALTGHVGAPLLNTLRTPSGGHTLTGNPGNNNAYPYEGYKDPAMITDIDLSNSALRIQFIPAQQTPAEDAPTGVPPPTSLTATGVASGVLLQAGLPPFDQFDSVQYFASADNNRTNAVLITEIKASSYVHPLSTGTTRYYWVRDTRSSLDSDFFPSSPTCGVAGTAS